jgi:hypothetical protein
MVLVISASSVEEIAQTQINWEFYWYLYYIFVVGLSMYDTMNGASYMKNTQYHIYWQGSSQNSETRHTEIWD